jgi:hypothetical protein
MKMRTNDLAFLKFFDRSTDRKEIKLKTPREL